MEEVKQKALNTIADAVLRIPIDREKFIIQTDTSDKGIGAILAAEVEGQIIPIESYSKTYNETNKK